MGAIIDGKAVASEYKEKIKEFVQDRIKNELRVPCLASVLVGNDGGSIYYVNNQSKLCNTLGVNVKNIILDENIKEDELIRVIDELNNNKDVDGIIILVPLPKHLNEKNITSRILPAKDVDGMTDINLGKFYKGEKCFVPCTPRSVLELIKSTDVGIEGKHAVIIGRSNIVGKPAAQLLLNENATVTICHSKTQNLETICKGADILVSCIGKPGFVKENYIKEGAIVIDVGTTMVDGKVKGDVDFEEVIKKAAYVTPVPGGVGSMTTTMLIKNTCEALEKNVY